jgi:glycosyltransferase involved in cell wall biosynthesis
MKIAVNTRILRNPQTGIQNFIINLYGYLRENDHTNSYQFYQTGKSSRLGPAEMLEIPDNNIWNVLFDTLLVLILILKNKPDIYHGPSHVLPIFKVGHTKYILTIHDLSFIQLPDLMNKYWSYLYKLLTRISVKNADLIITDSENTKNDVIRIYHPPAARVKSIYLGISEKYFSAVQLPVVHPRPYLLTVATHPLRKNILSALRAYSSSDIISNKYDFLIVGRGSGYDNVSAEVSRLKLNKKVFLKGEVAVNELLSLYQHAAFFIYPSYYEGFGLPVLEAMAMRVPVIASKASSLPEIVPDKRWLVDPYSVSDIRLKMEELLRLSDSERKVLIDKNYSFARTFTWKNTADKYLKAFKTC